MVYSSWQKTTIKYTLSHMKKFSLNSKIKYFAAAFALPVVIVIASLIIGGISPFGEKSLIMSDTRNQYMSFFTYFKSVISEGHNLTYTYSKTMGGDLLGFFAYYLNNPFLFILFFFDTDNIAAGITVMQTVQIGCMGLTFYAFLRNRYGDNFKNIVFSTAYALCGYTMAYLTSPIYYCDLILLPLVILGIDRLLEKRKPLLYIVSLMAAVWCNYYLGYMICIFSLVYFGAKSIAEKRLNLKAFGDFVLSSLLSIGVIMFWFAPAILSIRGTKHALGVSAFKPRIMYGLKQLIWRMIPGAFDGNLDNQSAPCLFVGTIILLLAVWFFFNKRIELRQRLSYLVLLAIVFGSTLVSTFDNVWHGFNEPVGFSHRYAFLISFALIFIARESFEHLETSKVHESSETLRSRRGYQTVIIALAVLQIGELSFNALRTFEKWRDLSTDRELFANYVNEMGPLIDEIKSSDNSFYRIEKDVEYSHDDAMLFDYNGLSHNSSCEKDDVKFFIGRMGFRNQEIWSFYNQGSTIFADSLFGIRYFISRFNSTIKPYELISNSDNYFVYRNDYALPVGFVTTDAINDIDMTCGNPYEIQEGIYESFGDFDQNSQSKPGGELSEDSGKQSADSGKQSADSGKQSADSGELLNRITDVKITLNNVTESVEDVENLDGTNTGAVVGPKCNVYRKIDSEQEASVEYTFTTDKAASLSYYFQAPFEQWCHVYVDDRDFDDYFTDFRWAITNFGTYSAGDEVTVKIVLGQDELYIYDAYFYQEFIEKIPKWRAAVNTPSVNVDGTIITAEATAEGENDILVFTIPYEKDWEVTVDGVKAEPVCVMDALLGVKIDQGSHSITAQYVPTSRRAGIAVSIISLLLCAVWIWRLRKNNA